MRSTCKQCGLIIRSSTTPIDYCSRACETAAEKDKAFLDLTNVLRSATKKLVTHSKAIVALKQRLLQLEKRVK